LHADGGDPAMRWIVGGKASQGCAASPSQMGRFETQWLAAGKNLSTLADLLGQWIDRVNVRRAPRDLRQRRFLRLANLYAANAEKAPFVGGLGHALADVGQPPLEGDGVIGRLRIDKC
jgi:hypothetical protein